MTIYLQENNLIIRKMEQPDGEALHKAFAAQGWHKPLELFCTYLAQQEKGEKTVIVAEVAGGVAGYVALLPEAKTGPYACMGNPEIVDFNVLIQYQRQGIGGRMMDVGERLASETSSRVSLAVGLHSGYGSAQRMYVKRGYIPDGSGVWYQEKLLGQYAACVNDDDLNLYLIKEL